nr:unnamed protein product [Callosobruchus chinensis]
MDFGQLSLEDKIKIKEMGRPLPDLDLKQISGRKSKNKFCPTLFERHI